MKNKIFFDKLAVFDLDDTLYNGNSHLLILNAYYNFGICYKFLLSILWKITPAFYTKLIWYLYNKIPGIYIKSFDIEFRKGIIEILKEKETLGFKIIIVSNAPSTLIEVAANKLNLDWFHTKENKKSEIIKNRYKYNYLFVCTDNKTDLDILKIANSYIICCKKKEQPFFLKNLNNPNFYQEG